MVHLPAGGHPSKYYACPVSINFVDQANALTSTLRRRRYKFT